MKKLRVAIIGQGRSGFDIHAHLLMLMPNQFRVVAIADPLDGNRKRGQQALGCDAYTDYHDLFKRDDLDLIVNATPSHLHVPVSLEILDAGFNAISEKPAAKAASEVDSLIAKQKKTGKMMAVFQQARFAPYFRQVKKLIDSGIFGRTRQGTCSPDQRKFICTFANPGCVVSCCSDLARFTLKRDEKNLALFPRHAAII